ncbi:MAG: ATP-grasp domain-containing protein [Deltaproteobacteria bacterium]|nr:ATP-grasp domain-containing protein [Deltaproteobacteria bacterium]
MFKKVTVANRGTVASRVVNSLREMDIRSHVLCSEVDQENPYVREADEFTVIGPAPPKDSYLNQDAIIEAAKKAKSEAIHPGYGFLAESPEFAKRVTDEGLIFIGPSSNWLAIMGDKVAARNEMFNHGFPMSPFSKILTGSYQEQAAEARRIGFPLIIKPAHGGGGIGMITVTSEDKLVGALEAAASQAERGFGRREVYAERMIEKPRHVEFQVVSDGEEAVTLFERDCSIQRRRQKILEEAGAPLLPRAQLEEMGKKAAQILAKIGYDHLGTVETLYSTTGKDFGFLEVNPRLQVEHAITEEITGVDLVKTQLRLAGGQRVADIFALSPVLFCGHSIEARVYAEDSKNFYPSPGPLKVFKPPRVSGVRVETGYAEGGVVTPYYDPMLAQVIVHANTRDMALGLMEEALKAFEVEGIKTNIGFLRALLRYEPFKEGLVHTALAEELIKSPGYKPVEN